MSWLNNCSMRRIVNCRQTNCTKLIYALIYGIQFKLRKYIYCATCSNNMGLTKILVTFMVKFNPNMKWITVNTFYTFIAKFILPFRYIYFSKVSSKLPIYSKAASYQNKIYLFGLFSSSCLRCKRKHLNIWFTNQQLNLRNDSIVWIFWVLNFGIIQYYEYVKCYRIRKFKQSL